MERLRAALVQCSAVQSHEVEGAHEGGEEGKAMSDDGELTCAYLRIAALENQCARLHEAVESGLEAVLRLDARLKRLEQQQPTEGEGEGT